MRNDKKKRQRVKDSRPKVNFDDIIRDFLGKDSNRIARLLGIGDNYNLIHDNKILLAEVYMTSK